MRQNNRAPHRAHRLVPAVALTAALIAGGAVTAAPAFAAAGQLSLTVHTPAVVGFAGGPVEFTEHIGNTGGDTTAVLSFEIGSDLGTPPRALSLDYFDGKHGDWRSVGLTQHPGEDGMSTDGATAALPVPAGGTDVRLRIGVPMGSPHDGATNGSTGLALSFHTTLRGGDDPAQTEPLTDTHRIAVDGIRNGVSGAPATAVRGGAPIEFDVVLRNPTPSAYTNLGNVLFVDRSAKVEVRGADGGWTALPAVTTEGETLAGHYLDGRNSSAAPNSSHIKRVRVGYPAGVPVGTTQLNPCVFVNEGNTPFMGTTMCSQGATVRIDAPAPKPDSTPEPTATFEATATATPPSGSKGSSGSGGSTGSHQDGGAPVVQSAGDVTAAPATPAAATASTAGSPAAAAVQPVDANLASTGTDSDRTGLMAGLGAVLVGAGTAAFTLVRRRRTN
ncbi:hypothetical protein [Kitasatospora brasiliensis]|uniref:hypothetical protein n=1 Tax=Kitasatospora brasiliensis TaxID=3058040 RepID=UPI00292CED38|nr:hypothetical protein [Kitasatospora sp. K002]